MAPLVAGGLTLLGTVVRAVATGPSPVPTWVAFTLAFTGLAFAGRLQPLPSSRLGPAGSAYLDEGALVALLMLVPLPFTVMAFTVATVAATALRRTAVPRAAVDLVTLLAAVGLSALVFRIAQGPGPLTLPRLSGATLLATAAFVAVTSAPMALATVTMGLARQAVPTRALAGRAGQAAVGAGAGLLAALTLRSQPVALPLAVLPLALLHHAAHGHLAARRNQARTEGLSRAVLEVNASVGRGSEAVEASVLASARALLCCPQAQLAPWRPEAGALSAPVARGDGTQWLSVWGRGGAGPFDSSDKVLLEALASVAAAALSNGALYRRSQAQGHRLAAVTSSLGEGVCAISASGKLTYMNQAAAALLGWDILPDLGDEDSSPGLSAGVPAPDFLWAAATGAMASGATSTSYEARFRRADGSYVDVECTVAPNLEEGGTRGAVLVFRDVSEQRRLQDLARQALHDPLTGLPNRRQFLDELRGTVERSRRTGERHAVLFIDVDRFKVVNDRLGHEVGDRLLVAITRLIEGSVRAGDLVARLGGDEFIVLVRSVTGAAEAEDVARRIVGSLHEPLDLGNSHRVRAQVSIGIALTSAGRHHEEVLHDADVAMYRAKARSGSRHRYCVFDALSTGARPAGRTELESELRQAVGLGQFELYYQPLFSMMDRRLVSLEALVRWRHPRLGLLKPAAFLDLAESTGLMLDLGHEVLERAFVQARHWSERLGTAPTISINLAARQFEHPGFLADVEALLRSTGADPGQFCFEVAERLTLEDMARTNEVLKGLKRLGASVAIDDFGTGRSALDHLADLQVDVVKLDRELVHDVENDPVKSAVVSAVLTLTRAVESTTVVEGVETELQLEHLVNLGCNIGQGYLFSRPLPPEEVELLMGLGAGSPAPAVPQRGAGTGPGRKGLADLAAGPH